MVMILPGVFMFSICLAKSKKRIHEPSRYRALVREMKSGKGRPPEVLLDEARLLKDPYYVSLSLFSLSSHKKLSVQQAFAIASEALVIASKVPRLWHRAELLTIIAKKTSSWRDDKASNERKQLGDELLNTVISMPNGKELLDIFGGCASRFECGQLAVLLSRALINSGFELSSGKMVIRQWILHCNPIPAVEKIIELLDTVEDPLLRAKLMGYMGFQCRKLEQCNVNTTMLFRTAIEESIKADEKQRLDILRYLAKLVANDEECMLFRDALNHLDMPTDKIRLLTTLGGCMDKAGFRTTAIGLFKDAWHLSTSVTNPYSRATLRYNIAQGFAQCEERESAQQVYCAAVEDCGDNIKLRDKLHASSKEYGIVLSRQPDKIDQGERMISEETEISDEKTDSRTRHVLGLYDTYEGAVSHVHLRAIARAVPLCIAFDMDLALMGFPTENLQDLMQRVVAETNIKKTETYLNNLIQQKRVMLVKCNRHTPPEDWNRIGMPVATTSHPDEEKRNGLKEVIRIASSQHPLRRACFIMGLGRKGLPYSLLHMVSYHLELTGRNVSLETCTVMGVIAQQIHDTEGSIAVE
jgi:hypothetical protein